MSVDDILLETEERMEQARRAPRAASCAGLRSGRATPALVDKLRVDAYETQTPLAQLAQIGCPEPRQILIKPFDALDLEGHREGDPGEQPGPQPAAATARCSASSSRRSPRSAASSS